MLKPDLSGTHCPQCWERGIAPLFLLLLIIRPAETTPPHNGVSSGDEMCLFGYTELMHMDTKHTSNHWSFLPGPAETAATDRKTRQHLQRHIWLWRKS